MRVPFRSTLQTVVVALTACLVTTQARYAGVPARQNLRLREIGVGTPISAIGATPSPVFTTTELTVEAGFMLCIKNHLGHNIYAYFEAKAPNMGDRQGLLKPPTLGLATANPVLWCPGINSTTPDLSLTVPKNSSIQVMLPMNITSGRVYLSMEKLPFLVNGEGKFADPTTVNVGVPEHNMTWGFVELSHVPPPADPMAVAKGPTGAPGEFGIWANPSFVDFVGIMLGISVKPKDGAPHIVKGLMPDAIPKICKALEEHSTKYSENPAHSWWKKLCIYKDSQPLRIMSPNLYRDMTKSWSEGAPEELLDYYDSYVARVWDRYASSPLKINTQLHGNSNETEVGDLCLCTTPDPMNMFCQCAGNTNWTLPRPTSTDIFGCNSGTFSPEHDGVVSYAQLRSRLCAGFVRSTLLLNDMSPTTAVMPDKYYPEGEITDYYSKIVHENLYDSMGYTFSFDDVDPVGHNSAGLIKVPYVQSMNIVVGGWHEDDELELGEEGLPSGASSAGTSSSGTASTSSVVSASVVTATTGTTSSTVSTSSGATTS